MNLLKRLSSLFGGGGAPRGDKRYMTVYVLSRRCNEPVSGQVDLLNELSKADEGEYAYYTRKVLHTTGEHRCFAQVEINLYFNQGKQIVHHEVEGGRWLTSDEYSAELTRFNTPPPEENTVENKVEDNKAATGAVIDAPQVQDSPKPAQSAPTSEENNNA